METKVQKMYKEALKKGDIMGAIKLLHYKPELDVKPKKVKVVEAVVEEEAPVVKSKKKKYSKKE